ncbi:TPA: DNA-binding protein [Klebsiella oxytoca]|nr:DNA-binding protein [Klebsiella oxytoca]
MHNKNKKIIIILILLMPGDTDMTQSSIPADVRDRIIAAAVELYEQDNRESFPTVDAVRRAARADMNTTSAVMREWRRQQTVQAAPVAVTVPEVVAQANTAALAALWQQAQELANESLRAAQAGWENEREELDAMRAEMADAYESQAAELDQVRAELERVSAAASQAHAELAATKAELSQAVMRAERAETKAEEVERRASDLRAELDRAHLDADQARVAYQDQQNTSDKYFAEMEKARNAAAEAVAKNRQLDAELAELLEAKQQASALREEVARLNGAMATYKEMLDRFEVATKTATRARKEPKAEG